MNKNTQIGNMPVYVSYPDDGQKHPGLIVIHEIWGLVPHMKDVADRFAAQGYVVVAPDLFHDVNWAGKVDQSLLDDMHDPAKRDEAQLKMRALFAPVMKPEFGATAVGRLKECVDYLLAQDHVNDEIGALGFCFGGTYALALAAHDDRVKAAVPFYGQPLSDDAMQTLHCPVLAFYGDQDVNLMQSLPKFKEEMSAAGKELEAVVYPDTGHAFFNDTNPRMYRPVAAKDAWEKAVAFLAKNLKR